MKLYHEHPWLVAFGFSVLVMLLDILIIVFVWSRTDDVLKQAFAISFLIVIINAALNVAFIKSNTKRIIEMPRFQKVFRPTYKQPKVKQASKFHRIFHRTQSK